MATIPILSELPASISTPGFKGTMPEASSGQSSFQGNDHQSSFYEEYQIDPAGQNVVHSATLANLPGGGIRAWWYGGSREGGRDVAIYSAEFDPRAGSWGSPEVVMTRAMLSEQLHRYIKKLGNPAAFLDDQDRLWLFFVSVSVGGWAGSSVNYMISTDGGESYGPVHRLTTSPFFNVSTLVRGDPVPMTEGVIALPAYHEFIGKHAELLMLSPDGSLRTKKRLSWGRDALQPVLVPTSPDDAMVFMRYAGEPPRRILYSRTSDSGQTFTRPIKLSLPNIDNSVAATLRNDGGSFIVYNNSSTARHVLSLAVSSDNSSGEWVRVYDFENSGENTSRRFSYPAVLRDHLGNYHVAWTHDRTFIKHVVFNDAWLRTLINAQEG